MSTPQKRVIDLAQDVPSSYYRRSPDRLVRAEARTARRLSGGKHACCCNECLTREVRRAG